MLAEEALITDYLPKYSLQKKSWLVGGEKGLGHAQ
jgi:hypothetical protein